MYLATNCVLFLYKLLPEMISVNNSVLCLDLERNMHIMHSQIIFRSFSGVNLHDLQSRGTRHSEDESCEEG